MICSVLGCQKEVRTRGWCHMHYRRWYEHGDPNIVIIAKSARGSTSAFLEDTLQYLGDECVFWPFATDKDGYAKITVKRRSQRACRIICIRLYGPPPVDRPLSAHSCGNGHLGCVTPAHLGWSSAQENMNDMIQHGRSLRGGDNSNTKLTRPIVQEIFRRAHRGEAQLKLADEFHIHQGTISRIKLSHAWGWLTGDQP